jgi:hypothetical protein
MELFAPEIDEIRRKIDADDLDGARERLSTIDARGMHSNELHKQLASIAEELGMSERIVLELNLAYRDAPEDLGSLKRLAVVRRDAGQFEKAEKCLRQVLQKNPADTEAMRELGAVLEEGGNLAAAREVYRQALDIAPDESLRKALKALERLGHEQPSPDEENETAGAVPDEAQLVRFLSLFSGREGAYSRQWVTPMGECGYTPIHEPFTIQVAKNHLIGSYTVGLYQLRVDNTITFIAFDLDVPKSMVAKIATDRKAFDAAMKMIHGATCRVVEACAALSIPAYIEDSGQKGRHVWIFLDEPIPARLGRNFALTLLSRVSGLPPQVNVEIFPKQTVVKSDGLGNLIKLPLGIHRKTGRKGVFVDQEGKEYGDQWSYLFSIRKAPREAILAAITESPPDGASGVRTRHADPSIREEDQAPRHVFPAAQEYDPERDEELQYILLRCPVLRSLVEKANARQDLTSDEILVLTHSLGHIRYGPDAVNSILQRSAAVNESLFLKSRLKGNPISCPRIRSRVPSVSGSVDCNCQFDPRTNMYPTPLLHLQSMERGNLAVTMDSLNFQILVQDFLKAKRNLAQLEELVARYQERLGKVFEDAGCDEIQTPFGKLRKQTGVSGAPTFSLSV